MDIILISEKKNKTINLHIKFWLIIVAVIIFIVIIGSFIYGIANFATEEIDKNKLIQLKEENKVVQREMTKIEKEIFNLYSLIDSLELYGKKLQTHGSLTPFEQDLQDSEISSSTPASTTGHVSADLSKNSVDLDQTLNNLLARGKVQKESFNELLTHLEEKRYLKDHIPSIIPVQGWLIRGFGYQVDPFTGTVKMHEGLDIAAPPGTPIIAPADGRVTFAGTRRGFGITVEINHGYGCTTRYAHCQRSRVRAGMNVKRGDIVAYVGNTGTSIGPHLHYEVRIAQQPVNPINYILAASQADD